MFEIKVSLLVAMTTLIIILRVHQNGFVIAYFKINKFQFYSQKNLNFYAFVLKINRIVEISQNIKFITYCLGERLMVFIEFERFSILI